MAKNSNYDYEETMVTLTDEDGVDRDFYIDYLAEMPGIISPDASEIAKAVSGDDFDLRKVRLFAEKYVSEQRDCTKKLAEFVLKEMQ